MKALFLLMFLVGCSTKSPAPKYYANQKVEFEWSEQGKFWSKACKNEAVIKNFRYSLHSDVVYSAEVECHGWDGSMYSKFSIKESQITRVIE